MAYELTRKQEALLKHIKMPRTIDKDPGEDERLIALHTVETLVMQIREEREREQKQAHLARLTRNISPG